MDGTHPTSPLGGNDKNVPKLMEHVESLKIVRQNALSAIARAQEKWKGDTGFKPYKAGDCVWLEGTHLHTTHPTQKLRPKQYGPFKVL